MHKIQIVLDSQSIFLEIITSQTVDVRMKPSTHVRRSFKKSRQHSCNGEYTFEQKNPKALCKISLDSSLKFWKDFWKKISREKKPIKYLHPLHESKTKQIMLCRSSARTPRQRPRTRSDQKNMFFAQSSTLKADIKKLPSIYPLVPSSDSLNPPTSRP